MTHFAQDERQALCDLFLKVGPDAPTLCEGWTTGDLAAHLVIRERRPDAAAGALLPPLSGYTNKVLRATKNGRRWEQLVARLRSGPPIPLRLVDEAMNTVEYFVHHEDARRAVPGWEPRQLDPAEERALWSRLRMGGRMLARRVPVGLVAEAPGFGRATLKGGEPVVTAQGAPGELVLFIFGRGAVARVEYEGDEISVERLRHARLGL
ncbi:MAG TPA: TIGR03085 family metal-binding protein [Acidimicrobiales bacterium]